MQRQNKKHKPSAETKSKAAAQFSENDSLVAVVRVRGNARVAGEIVDTLQMLNLHKKNYCSVYKDTPSIRGMLLKVKDYVTYGTIDYTLYKQVLEKRGEQDTRKGELKKFFRLHPPRKGFERKGIKVAYAQSGALGDRKERMGQLLMRMI